MKKPLRVVTNEISQIFEIQQLLDRSMSSEAVSRGVNPWGAPRLLVFARVGKRHGSEPGRCPHRH